MVSLNAYFDSHSSLATLPFTYTFCTPTTALSSATESPQLPEVLLVGKSSLSKVTPFLYSPQSCTGLKARAPNFQGDHSEGPSQLQSSPRGNLQSLLRPWFSTRRSKALCVMAKAVPRTQDCCGEVQCLGGLLGYNSLGSIFQRSSY